MAFPVLAARGVSLSLQVKIDPVEHDCRFLPSIGDVEDTASVAQVRMDLYENATGEFSYNLLHTVTDDPVPVSDFQSFFEGFTVMPDGFYADDLGYYHTAWHYYELTVTMADGTVAQVKSRPFKVPENALHVFCAQIVDDPYSGVYTYKPASQTVYKLTAIDPTTGQVTGYKKQSDTSEMDDIYSVHASGWTDSVFVFAQLPLEALKANGVTWTVTGSGGSDIPAFTSTHRGHLAQVFRVSHFADETFDVNLRYDLPGAARGGGDSIVTLHNHQTIKMRLPTPCFAYNDAVYCRISADSVPTPVAVEQAHMKGMLNGAAMHRDPRGVSAPDARLLHMDVLSYLFVSPNSFAGSDPELHIRVTDTMYPDDAARSRVTSYGPFKYSYFNTSPEYGEVILHNVPPSDWIDIDPVTGRATPVPHRWTIEYTSDTHEFYYSQSKNVSLLDMSPSFTAPSVTPVGELQGRYRDFGAAGGGWHHCLCLGSIEDYQEGNAVMNNNTAIPAPSGTAGAPMEYFAIGSRADSSQPFDFAADMDNMDNGATFVNRGDLTADDGRTPKLFCLHTQQCGDGIYREGMWHQKWQTQPEYEVGVGRVYFFAVDDTPAMDITIGGVTLMHLDRDARMPSLKASDGATAAKAQAFVPAMSSNTFLTDNVITGVDNVDVEQDRGGETGVYNLAGIRVSNGSLQGLASGIYIQVTADGGARKVAVQ